MIKDDTKPTTKTHKQSTLTSISG
uniref:Uncharacterized protein n=1 Tax=Tetranychus urticae TaxID=32264 RepID=T1L3R2_TETUR